MGDESRYQGGMADSNPAARTHAISFSGAGDDHEAGAGVHESRPRTFR